MNLDSINCFRFTISGKQEVYLTGINIKLMEIESMYHSISLLTNNIRPAKQLTLTKFIST